MTSALADAFVERIISLEDRLEVVERVLAYAPEVGAKLARVAAQPIPNSIVTLVQWDTVNRQTHVFHTSPGVLTIPTGMRGKYAIASSISWATSAIGVNLIRLLAGGIAYDYSVDNAGGTSSVGETVHLDDLDTVQVQVFQVSGAPINITGYFQMWRMGN